MTADLHERLCAHQAIVKHLERLFGDRRIGLAFKKPEFKFLAQHLYPGRTQEKGVAYEEAMLHTIDVHRTRGDQPPLGRGGQWRRDRMAALLYRTTREDYDHYLERHVQGKLEPYLDGLALTRFRTALFDTDFHHAQQGGHTGGERPEARRLAPASPLAASTAP